MKGKKLEAEVLASLHTLRGWSYRLNDKVFTIWTPKGMRAAKTESPADLIHVGKEINLLLECKEESGKSLSFSRLKPHQLQSLLEFEWVNPQKNRAYVVVQFLKEHYVCIAVPIRVWLKEEFVAERKSAHFSRLQEIGIPLERIKGSMWNVKPLTVPTVSICYTWKEFSTALNITSFLRRKTFKNL